MDNRNYLAQANIGEHFMLRLLKIGYNAVLTCDRDCCMLEESRLGNLVCGHKYVKKIANFQSKALLVEYEFLLDKHSDEFKRVYESAFQVIDSKGRIYKGQTICEEMISPERCSEEAFNLYPGTRAACRLFFRTFPKDETVASVVYDGGFYGLARIDLDSGDGLVDLQPDYYPHDRLVDLQKRIEVLEKEIGDIRNEIRNK